MNEYTFSLPRLVFVAGVICVLDVMSMSPSFGMLQLGILNFLPPAMAMIVLPPLVGVVWLVLFVLGLKFHGLKGLWLLLPLIVIIPASLVFLLTWGCVYRGACI